MEAAGFHRLFPARRDVLWQIHSVHSVQEIHVDIFGPSIQDHPWRGSRECIARTRNALPVDAGLRDVERSQQTRLLQAVDSLLLRQPGQSFIHSLSFGRRYHQYVAKFFAPFPGLVAPECPLPSTYPRCSISSHRVVSTLVHGRQRLLCHDLQAAFGASDYPCATFLVCRITKIALDR